MKRLPGVAPHHEFVFFAPRGHYGPGLRTIRLPTWQPLVRIAWEQLAEPVEARRLGLDLLHSPVNIAPLAYAGPSVVTLHDLAFLEQRHRYPRAKGMYLNLLIGGSLRRSKRIIVPSDSTRAAAIELLGVKPEKITVVPLGVDESFTRTGGLARPVRERYILYVGTLEPRKNLPLLLRTFARLKSAGYPHRLVLIGPKGWMYQEILDLIASEDLRDAVILTGYVEDLVPWYNSADLFVYPSMYEGFGLPLLEAMACGTPVLTSASTSMIEVVGTAALVVPPDDEDSLLMAMQRIIDDPGTASALSSAGLERASMFSWDETARKTVAVYEQVAAELR